MGGRISEETYRAYARKRLAGSNTADAAASAGISVESAFRFDKGQGSSALSRRIFDEMCAGQWPFTELTPAQKAERTNESLGLSSTGALDKAPVLLQPLSHEAKRALNDFDYFRRRYLGRITLPWHVEAAEKLVSLLLTPDKEYVVMNMPPGSGKTTLLHDIAAWITVRNRAIRGMFGSSSASLAMAQVRRLRKTLERSSPYEAKDADLTRGLAVNAVATLMGDYGTFQSPNRDRWRDDEFVVMQYDGNALGDKEMSWSAYGRDSQVLGWRVDLAFWDDLVTKRALTNDNTINTDREWYDDEAETRLDPGGLLAIVGQRLSPRELYRYCLDKKLDPYDVEEINLDRSNAMYHHIKFQAHDDEHCDAIEHPEHHDLDAKPYPLGCLLDPKRLPWRELQRIKGNDSRKYETVYQQHDTDPATEGFDAAWIYGGIGRDGLDYDGCLDLNRHLWETPDGIKGLGIVTVDPSPTQYWAIQSYLYQKPLDSVSGDKVGGTRWLLDVINARMSAPEFLDFNYDAGRFTGALEMVRTSYLAAGHRLSYVVFEVNAAQRWVSMYEHAKRWCSQHGVKIVPHTTTGRNKHDPDYGVSALGSHYRFGRYRYPFADNARHAVRPLIDQLLGRSDFDDQIMANWFLEAALPNLATPELDTTPPWRPSWLTSNRRQ